MSCRWCKIITGAIILVALTAALAAIISSGGGAFPVWTKFITWLGGQLGIEGGAALKELGYKLFATILAVGAALVYVLAQYIDWILCKICELLGSCSDCPSPSLNPPP